MRMAAEPPGAPAAARHRLRQIQEPLRYVAVVVDARSTGAAAPCASHGHGGDRCRPVVNPTASSTRPRAASSQATSWTSRSAWVSTAAASSRATAGLSILTFPRCRLSASPCWIADREVTGAGEAAQGPTRPHRQRRGACDGRAAARSAACAGAGESGGIRVRQPATRPCKEYAMQQT